MESDSIKRGECYLGIELGSTRIKAVLINPIGTVVATGVHEWENRYADGIWTYSLSDVKSGISSCYRSLKSDVERKYGLKISSIKAIGISAMMHGYLAFDNSGNLLTPFRTWRNTITEKESDELTRIFGYPIPQRWTISHLLYDIKRNEPYLGKLSYVMTLASYVHYLLTGVKAIGIGDASGMFPIEDGDYSRKCKEKFLSLYGYDISNLFPKVLTAGENAGFLIKEGAMLLDSDGELEEGIPFCPPEGDAGTGMVATNSVLPGSGNVSAGTSAFLMIVLKENLRRVHSELDIVTTPDGFPVAMAHTNNCTGDINVWIRVFSELLGRFGLDIDKSELYRKLFEIAMEGNPDCGGIVSYNYESGEPIASCQSGIPMLLRPKNADFTLNNFMRSELYSAIAAMRIGLDILFDDEGVSVNRIACHGGFFKTGDSGLKVMASALKMKVYALSTAGEGGAWGMALLASYLFNKGKSLAEYLEEDIFSLFDKISIEPDVSSINGFETFYKRYLAYLKAERIAGEINA